MTYYVIRGKVNQSQRLNEAPLQHWFICGEDGKVITAHCNCMAGLGETCFHLASIMFFVEATVHLRDKLSATQEAAYWKLPSTKKQTEYAPSKDIYFTSPHQLKREFEDSIASNSTSNHTRCLSRVA